MASSNNKSQIRTNHPTELTENSEMNSCDRLFAEKNASKEKAQIWTENASASQMLDLLDGLEVKIAPRKLRRFAIECCRLIPGFTRDPDCQQAIKYCEALIEGYVAEDEIQSFRIKLRERRMRIIDHTERAAVDEWSIAAAINLLQTDREYFAGLGAASLRAVSAMAMSAGVRTGREMTTVSDVRQSDLDNAATIIHGQAALLNEIIGNPFDVIDIQAGWLSEPVVRLAQEHDKAPHVTTMVELHDALRNAGCSDERILRHCQSPYLHPRGCWLIDLLLGKPTIEDSPFAWDYELSLDGFSESSLASIKRKIREISCATTGTLRNITKQDGNEFSTWLEDNGFSAWANFCRCAAEIDEPTNAECYSSAVARYDMLYCCCRYRINLPHVYLLDRELWPRWWSEHHVNMKFGLPSAIHATPPGSGKLNSVTLIKSMSDAMTHLPIRDVNFAGQYFAELPDILSSSAGQAITTFRCDVERNSAGVSPLRELAESGLARTLERLVLRNWIDDKAVLELADMPLDSIQDLDFFEVCGARCDADTFAQLAKAAWFQRLRSLRMNLRGTCCRVAMPLLSRLEQLRTLAIADSPEDIFSHSPQQLTFPALQRLYLGVDQVKVEIKKLCDYSAPHLMDFWLSSNHTIGKHLITLFNSELLSTISVLRLTTPGLTNQALDALLQAPMAKNLRVLELLAMSTNGLSKKSQQVFAEPTAISNLVSLTLVALYAKKDFSACAQWLRSIDCRSLRHLTLKEFKLDDSCLKAIMDNPCFRKLESLTIDEGYGESRITPNGAEQFVRSLDFPDLRSFQFHRSNMGDRIACLLDHSCLPSVKFASFSNTLASQELIQSIESQRPNFVISR